MHSRRPVPIAATGPCRYGHTSAVTTELEEQRLLAAIVETPDDDAPRLVYADWLQSRGDPRGELILLQCQLAADPDDDRRRAIRITENKLLAAHLAGWLEPLRAVLPPGPEFSSPYKFELHRGFVEEAHLTVDCASSFAALWERAPVLRRLHLGSRISLSTPLQRPRLGTLLDGPEIARLQALSLTLGGGGNDLARELAGCVNVRNVRELELRLSVWGEAVGLFEPGTTGLVLDDAGAAALARSPNLTAVDKLVLEGNRLTAAGVAELAHGTWRLRHLDLGYNIPDPAKLAAALDGPAFAGLEVLILSNIAFDPPSIAALVSAPVLSKLRELDLEKCHLGVAGIQALCRSLGLPELRRLRLERNSVCDAGALAVAGCEAFSRLTSLEAGHNRIGHKGGAALASSPYLANLERLTLNEPRWKPETAALFASSPTLARTKIYLQGRLVGRKKTPPVTTASPRPAPTPPTAPARATTAARTVAAQARSATRPTATKAPPATTPAARNTAVAKKPRARRTKPARG